MPLSRRTTNSIFSPATPSAGRGEVDYADQNALGLAKIMAGAPPELAASMQRAYENRTEHSESLLGGLWKSVTSPLRKTLEFFGDVGSATSEPFRNEPEGEEDNALKDVMQGLNGEENTMWKDNLMSYGMEDNWATTALGLVGDVFLDPLNYVGAGGLGLSRDVVATGAKELGEYGAMSLLRKQVEKEGGLTLFGRKVTDADDLPAIVGSLSRDELRNLGADEEILDALSGIAAGNADRTLLSGLDDLMQFKARWIGERLGTTVLREKSLRNLPPQLVDPTGQVWKREELLEIFEQTSRIGPEKLNALANEMFGGKVGFGTSGMVGRKAAAALGGVRIKFGIPFTKRLSNYYEKPWLGYRWQSSALPLDHRFKLFGSGEGPVLNKMGNFFRGVSGIHRLDTAVQQSLIRGDGLWKREDMEALMRMGFTGFQKYMIDSGRGGQFNQLFGNRAISSFMSAADRVGGLTAHITPKAQLWRRVGYTGMKAGQEIRNAQVMKKIFREFAAQHETEWSAASHQLDKAVAKGLDAEKVHDDMIRYIENLTDDVDVLPDFLRPAAKEMKAMFPRIAEQARKSGAKIGDINEVLARRHSDRALEALRMESSKLTERYTRLTDDLMSQQESVIAELGERVAKEQIDQVPRIAKLKEEIFSIQDQIAKAVESQKSLDLEISMMDEHDQILRALRPNLPVEKLTPRAYFHRRLTREAREALQGSLAAEHGSWGRAKKMSAQLERILSSRSFAESAEYLRRLHPEALKNVKNIWETNPFGVYASYAEDMAEAVYKAQLKGAAEHVMKLLGAVDNGLAMRVTAHVPAEYYPRNLAMDKVKARGGVAQKFTNLHEVLDSIHVAIGAKVYQTSHEKGRAIWQGREPWRERPLTTLQKGKYTVSSADYGEYLDISDLDDLQIPAEKLRASAEAKMDKFGMFKTTDEIGREFTDVRAMMEDIRKNGFKEPIIVDYNMRFGEIEVANGHHRLLAARKLVEEGVEEARYVPVVIRRDNNYELSHGVGREDLSEDMRALLDEADAAGVNFDWDEFNWMPEFMRPSDLFAKESGRLGKLGAMTDDEATRMQIALHELNRAKTQAHGMEAVPEAAMFNKKIQADIDERMWGHLDIPGLEDFVMHPFMAAEFNRAYRGPASLPEWRRNWRKFVLGPWKKAATIYFPGFHARNFMGAYYNNFLGGVTNDHYSASHRIMDVLRKGDESEWAKKVYAKKMRLDGEVHEVVTYGDLATSMMSRGIVGGNSLAVADLKSFLGKQTQAGIRGRRPISSRLAIGKVGRYQDELLGQVTYAEQFMRKWEAWGIRTTNTTENYFRGAAYLKGLEDAAGDTAAARGFVMMRHGDYDELTDFENGIRDLVPFYKWMRTNLPFQVKRLFEDPAKTAATIDVQNSLISEDERKKMQSWFRDSLTIPMPKALAKMMGSKDGGGILTAQLPFHDLLISSEEFTSSFLPVIRQVVESGVLKKSIFTGAPLEGKRATEAAGWMHTTGIAQALAAVGFGKKGEGGKVYFTDREMNVANVFPIFARSRAFLTEDPERTPLRMASFVSAVAGIRPEKFGKEELNEGEREWYYDVLEPQLAQLAAMGYQLPTAYDLGMAANQTGGGNPFEPS